MSVGGDSPYGGHSFIESPLGRSLNLFALVIAVLSLAVAIPLFLITFVSNGVGFGSNEFLPFFLLIFPIVGWTFIVRYGRSDKTSRSGNRLFAITRTGTLGRLSPSTIDAGVVLIVVALLGGITSVLSGISGQPQYDRVKERYELNDHGVITVVTRDAYLHNVALWNRLFLSGAILFTTVALGVIANEWLRSRSRA